MRRNVGSIMLGTCFVLFVGQTALTTGSAADPDSAGPMDAVRDMLERLTSQSPPGGPLKKGSDPLSNASGNLDDSGWQRVRPLFQRAAGQSHSHDPVDVDSRPIVTRYKINLQRPRRLLAVDNGDLFIADWGAGAVLRMDADGDVSVYADGLNEPAGLALDGDGVLFVACHAQGMTGAGTIVRVDPDGMHSIFVHGLTGPTALAFDRQSNLYVAAFHEDAVLRITPGGQAETFVIGIPAPGALACDEFGSLFVASSTEGSVYRVTTMGEADVLARDLAVPSDLAFDRKGRLIVANLAGAELTFIDVDGTAVRFAKVPRNTVALAFDSEGNLLIVNWEYQHLMKVTTEVYVPCPHCDRQIPVRLRPQRKTPKERTRPMRGTDGPVI